MSRRVLALIVIFLLLTLIGAEAYLRASSSISFSIKARAVLGKLGFNNEYRILALGEADFTQPPTSWPEQLEKVLNEKNLGVKFTVINENNGYTSTALISALKEKIEKYKPEVIIAMMGIYDPYNPHLPTPEDPPSYFGNQENEPEPSLKLIPVVKRLLSKAKLRVYANHKSDREFIEIAEEYISQGKYDEAHWTLQRAVIVIETHGEGEYLRVAELLRRLGKTEEAHKLLDMAIAKGATDSTVFFTKGLLYLDSGELDKAAEMYRKAIELNPKDPYVYVELGKIHRLQKNYPEAEKWIKKALDIDRKNSHATFWLGAVYREMERFKESERWLRKLIEFEDVEVREHVEKARQFGEEGKVSEAENLYKSALEKSPKDGRIYLELGYLYQKSNRKDEAQEMFKKATALDQDLTKPAMPYMELSYLYRQLGRIQEAQEMENRAFTLNFLTPRNYKTLQSVVHENGVTLVTVQYPLGFLLNPTFRDFGEMTENAAHLIADNIANRLF